MDWRRFMVEIVGELGWPVAILGSVWIIVRGDKRDS